MLNAQYYIIFIADEIMLCTKLKNISSSIDTKLCVAVICNLC